MDGPQIASDSAGRNGITGRHRPADGRAADGLPIRGNSRTLLGETTAPSDQPLIAA
jgi:hypothetical protein